MTAPRRAYDDDAPPPPGGWNDDFGEEGRTPEEQDRAAEGGAPARPDAEKTDEDPRGDQDRR
jgi:hypothetical protein